MKIISYASTKWFIIINGFIISAGSLQYLVFMYYGYSLINIFISTIIKLLIIINILNTMTHDKNYVTPGKRTRSFHMIDFINTSLVETLSFAIVIYYYSTTNFTIIHDLILFIPRSFAFELILDFCHYWTHRILHTYPTLYTIIHKKHHEDHLINVNTSYNHTVADYLITNTMPLIISAYFVPSTVYFYNLVFWYKSFVEFSGHTGKPNSAGSFPQFIWIPKMLGIQLYSNDHNTHHTNPQYNFSKRFSIWDKLFGTFKN
jgi:sterol desaturase/sphingolipid hydroxylase (fatty acid hydroxylase superfamily)